VASHKDHLGRSKRSWVDQNDHFYSTSRQTTWISCQSLPLPPIHPTTVNKLVHCRHRLSHTSRARGIFPKVSGEFLRASSRGKAKIGQ
jgi:hypothetical protein